MLQSECYWVLGAVFEAPPALPLAPELLLGDGTVKLILVPPLGVFGLAAR